MHRREYKASLAKVDRNKSVYRLDDALARLGETKYPSGTRPSTLAVSVWAWIPMQGDQTGSRTLPPWPHGLGKEGPRDRVRQGRESQKEVP
jgi:hypothetical protein